MYTGQWPSIFIRDKPIISSERMFHKDYDCKGSARGEEKFLVVSHKKRLGTEAN
jgi:hypothetical protein